MISEKEIFKPQSQWLDFGNIDLQAISRVSEEQPFFVYSRNKLLERMNNLRAALPSDIHIAYSIKANPWQPLVQYMSTLTDGLDVTSSAELVSALNTGIVPDRIMFAGPGKSDEDLRCAIALGAVICMESTHEMRRIDSIASDIGSVAKVLIRVNPDFELKKVGMRMSGQSKPFGIDAELCPELLKNMPSSMQFKGLHIYWGSQCLDAEVIAEAQRSIIDMIYGLSEYFPNEPEIMNLGGGFGIPYTTKDPQVDAKVVGERMNDWLPEFSQRFSKATVFLELGRYLVGEAGVYICRVVDIKSSRGQKYLVTDGGLHHHLAASGNFGQVIRRNYPIAIANKFGLSNQEKADIVGCLCTPLDILGSGIDIPSADIGDYIAIFQSGAYAKSASPTGFLSHPEPYEFLL